MAHSARRSSALLLACLAAAAFAQSQEKPLPVPTNSAIMGQVVDAAGEPVSGAVVTLGGGLQQISITSVARELEGGPRRGLTDAYGRRRYGGLPQTLVLAEGERNTTV